MSLAFCAYLVLLIIRPQEFVSSPIGWPILQYLLLLCLLLWLFSPQKRLSLPQFPLAFLFLLSVIISVIVSGWLGGVVVAMEKLLPVLGMFVVATMAGRRLHILRVQMWIVLICACLIIVHSLIQLNVGIGPLTGVLPVQGRPYYLGIFSDPNDLGQLFVIALGFVTYLLSVTKRRVVKMFLRASLAWLVYGMILSDSRGALLATLAILGFEGWRRYGKTAVTIGAALALPVLFAATRLSQLSAGEQSANDRIQAWYEGFQMLRSNPLFGVGFDNFTDFSGLTAHNSIVLPMAELGLPGLTVWIGISWYSIRMLWWIAYGPHTRNQLEAGANPSAAVNEEVLAARGLFSASLGFGISAFFLSQSYKAPLFLLCGLAMARFAVASTVIPNPPSYGLLRESPRLILLSLTCVAIVFAIVKITL